ncbi:hypothetical protein [Thermotoga profunda]|nr:hypothetical protein [Thermotoga profunda]
MKVVVLGASGFIGQNWWSIYLKVVLKLFLFTLHMQLNIQER